MQNLSYTIIKKNNINNDNINEFQEIKELKKNAVSFSKINYSKWIF